MAHTSELEKCQKGAHGAEVWVLCSVPVPQERFGSFDQPCEDMAECVGPTLYKASVCPTESKDRHVE